MYNLEKNIRKLERTNNIKDAEKFIKEILENANYQKQVEIINDLLENRVNKCNRLINMKKYYELKHNNKKIFKINKELEKEQNLRNILLNLKSSLIKEIKSKHKLILELNKEQIRNIDKLIKEDTYSLIKKLYDSNSPLTRLEILEQLKEIYSNSIKHLRKKDTSRIYKEIKQIKRIQVFINDSIKIEHKRLSTNKFSEEEKEVHTSTAKEEEIISLMIKNEDINHYDLASVLKAYKKFIIENTVEYPKNVLKYAKEISTLLITNEVVDNDTIVQINAIKDTIKYRLLNLDKNDSRNERERMVLKELRIIFDFISKNYREDQSKTKHDYCYDVIFYFLQDESGYPYLKKIITELPSIVNTRKVLSIDNTNNNEHIIISILKEFIYNHKKMLSNKNSEFINPDYLKQVYILFSHSYSLSLTKEERDIIDNLISDYKRYIKDNITKFERQKEVKKELNALKTENYFMMKYPKLKELNKSQLIWQANQLKDNQKGAINRHNRKDLTQESTISFNDKTAYSLEIKDNKKKLKIHMIDLECMVPKNTTVDSQIYNDMIERKDIHYQVLRNFNFEYNNTTPCITYEITFENNNTVSDFNIYRSNVKVSKKCNDEDLYYKNNQTLNDIATLSSKILLINNIDFEYVNIPDIEDSLEMVLNKEFINYINEYNIPFIYSGIEYINDYVNNMNNLNTIFSRLNREQFKALYNLINTNVGEFGYSREPFNVEGEYELSLINKVDYLVLFNQRLIVDIILNNELVRSKEDYIKEVADLEHNLNLSINHIKPDDMKFKNKRKRNKLKEYNL